MSEIICFTINGKDQNAEIRWGEKVTIAWEIESATEIVESALLYPYHWPINKAKGSMSLVVYAAMDLIIKAKDPMNQKITQKSLHISLLEGEADSELYLTMLTPKRAEDPIARVRVEYTNAAYGYCSRGIGRVDNNLFYLAKGDSGKTYEYITPYQNQFRTGISIQNFACWQE